MPAKGKHIPSRCRDYSLKIAGAIHHDDGEDERCNEADGHGAHQRSGDDHPWVLAFLCQMYRTIDTGIHVVRRDETSEERDAVGPATIVQESSPHRLGRLEMRRGSHEASDDDHNKTPD
jgi:hypothetical protein